jgi:hypothetical protein
LRQYPALQARPAPVHEETLSTNRRFTQQRSPAASPQLVQVPPAQMVFAAVQLGPLTLKQQGSPMPPQVVQEPF